MDIPKGLNFSSVNSSQNALRCSACVSIFGSDEIIKYLRTNCVVDIIKKNQTYSFSIESVIFECLNLIFLFRNPT